MRKPCHSPPRECRLGRDIHGSLPRYPSLVNLVAVTFSPLVAVTFSPPLDPTLVQAIFLEAANYHDLADRDAILDRECLGDTDLRQRVEALLKAHDRSDEDRSFFLRCYWNL